MSQQPQFRNRAEQKAWEAQEAKILELQEAERRAQQRHEERNPNLLPDGIHEV